MRVINNNQNEKGFALVNTLIFIVFLGLVTVTIARLVVADMQQQAYYLNEKRAFYAAQSGIEYLIKGIEKSAPYYSSVSAFNNYTETLPTGNVTQCEIKISTIGIDSIRLEAIGKSGGFTKTIVKALKYADVSQYAVYAAGNVSNLRTIPSGRIKSNAVKMPLFDLNVLRNLAKPTRYYPGNLTINNIVNFGVNNIIFVENNLTFGAYSWSSVGNFVAGNSVQISSSWLPFGNNRGVFYLPNSGSSFSVGTMIFPFLVGGIVIDGNASCASFFLFRYTVFHNRTYINNLLSHSVNEGPLVFWNPSWSQK